YRLPELIEAIAAEQTVFIVEGEGKVDLVRAMNVPATCCAMGSGKWLNEHSEFFRGADVVLVPDNDDPGWAHVNDIAASLKGVAARVRILVLPGLKLKGDIRDWAQAGGTREQFDALVAQASDWKPPDESDKRKENERAEAKKREDEQIDGLAKMEPGIEF